MRSPLSSSSTLLSSDMAILLFRSILLLVLSAASLAYGSPAPKHVETYLANTPSRRHVVQAIGQELTRLSPRDRDWKNSTTFDRSWDGAVLLQLCVDLSNFLLLRRADAGGAETKKPQPHRAPTRRFLSILASKSCARHVTSKGSRQLSSPSPARSISLKSFINLRTTSWIPLRTSRMLRMTT